MHKDGYYSSGEFAKKSNVSVRTIRYYDQQNILKPSLLTDEGVRFYTDSDFTRLQQILLLKYLVKLLKKQKTLLKREKELTGVICWRLSILLIWKTA